MAQRNNRSNSQTRRSRRRSNVIENLNRVLTLKGLYENMKVHYIPRLVDLDKDNLVKYTEKSLRKDDFGEQFWATLLPSLLLLQLNGDPRISKRFSIPLFIIVQDTEANFVLRAQSCKTLSQINCFGDGNINFIYQLMEAMENIFSKNNDSPQSVTTEQSSLYTEAISSWTLLVTKVPSIKFYGWNGEKQQMFPAIKDLLKLFNSPYYNIREATAELLAVFLECGRKGDPNFLQDYNTDMIDVVKNLSIATQHYQEQRDPNAKKVTLENIIEFIENNKSLKVDLNLEAENLTINSWTKYHNFMTFYSLLNDGMLTHLKENNFVRSKLQMRQKIHMPKCFNPKMEQVFRFMQNVQL